MMSEAPVDSTTLTRKEEAYFIAKTLFEKYPGKLISKGGIKKMFSLPHVKNGEICKYLEDYGFKQESRQTMRIPTELLLPDANQPIS